MRYLFLICFLLIGLFGLSQSRPTGFPSPNSTGYSKVGYYRADSAFLMGIRTDTAWTPIVPALVSFKPTGQDTSRLFFYDGRKWKEVGGGGLDSLITNGIIEIDAPENQLLRYGGDNWRNTYRTDSSILPKAVTDSLYVTEVLYVVGAGADTLKYVKDGDTTTIGIIVQSGGGGGGGNSGTYLVSGGQVVWTGTGLNFFIQAATYYINGTLYSSRDTTVELTAADPTDPRIDGFVVDTTGQGYFITGAAAETPITPQADPTYQLFLTHVTINANDTIPAITNAVIYNNQDVGEWTPSSPVLYPIDFLQSTVSYVPPYAADFLSGGPSRYASFDLAPDSLNLNDYISISAFVKLKANLNNQNMGISVQMFKGSTPVTNQVRFAMNRTTTEWQAVQLPLGAFTYLGAQRYVDSISVIYRNFNGTGAIAGMYFDYFTFNNGIAPPSTGGNFVQQIRRKAGTDSLQYLLNNQWVHATNDSFYYTINSLTDTSFVINRLDGVVDTVEFISGNSSTLSYVDSIYRKLGQDSIFYTIGGGPERAIKDSTGGGGIQGTLNDSRIVFSADGEAKDTSTLVYQRSTGSVGINGTPNASAALDVSSTTKGFLPPRMTEAERDAIGSPAAGISVFQTTNNVGQYYDGNAWRHTGSDSGKDVNAGRLAGANTIAESYGCNAMYCSTTGSNQSANLAFFMLIYVPQRVTATGISHFFGSNVSVSGALYRLDSDSIRLVDTSAARTVTLNDFSSHDFVSQQTLNPGLYYAVFKGLSSVTFTRANVGTTQSVNISKIRSTNSNMAAYGFISSVTEYATSYHLNQITKTSALLYAALY